MYSHVLPIIENRDFPMSVFRGVHINDTMSIEQLVSIDLMTCLYIEWPWQSRCLNTKSLFILSNYVVVIAHSSSVRHHLNTRRRIEVQYTLLRTNISPPKVCFKMIFLFPRWDMIASRSVPNILSPGSNVPAFTWACRPARTFSCQSIFCHLPSHRDCPQACPFNMLRKEFKSIIIIIIICTRWFKKYKSEKQRMW